MQSYSFDFPFMFHSWKTDTNSLTKESDNMPNNSKQFEMKWLQYPKFLGRYSVGPDMC